MAKDETKTGVEEAMGLEPVDKAFFKAILGTMVDNAFEDMTDEQVLRMTLLTAKHFAKMHRLTFSYNMPCQECGGSGEVSAMEEVHAGEPQTMADVGSAPCPACRPPRDEDDSRDE